MLHAYRLRFDEALHELFRGRGDAEDMNCGWKPGAHSNGCSCLCRGPDENRVWFGPPS